MAVETPGVSRGDIEGFVTGIRGEGIRPADATYEEARSVCMGEPWNR